MQMQITSGKIDAAQRVVIYGPEGIGKSTWAAQLPKPVFLDTERGTEHMDVQRLPRPNRWEDIMEAVAWPGLSDFRTLVIDTVDWTERMDVEYVCRTHHKDSIEGFGYGKGYTYLTEEFGRLLVKLDILRDRGMNIVFTAHSTVKKIELPDEAGSFDHYELKCSKQVTPLLKEWADAVLFVNYKVNVQQNDTGKTKATGGKKRMLLAAHTAAYDAKNRWGLPDESPIETPAAFGALVNPYMTTVKPTAAKTETTPPPKEALPPNCTTAIPAAPDGKNIPTALQKLMDKNGITEKDLRSYMEERKFIEKGKHLLSCPPNVYNKMIEPANWKIVVTRIAEATKKQGAK